jgi:hypothetical protein
VVGRPCCHVVVVGEDEHAVAAALACERGERLDERAAVAPPPRRLVDRELVEEHLGALVGMGELDSGDEADGPLAVVGDEQVMTRLGQEPRRSGWVATELSKRCSAAATAASSPGPSARISMERTLTGRSS